MNPPKPFNETLGYALFAKKRNYYQKVANNLSNPYTGISRKDIFAVLKGRCRKPHTKEFPVIRCEICRGCNVRSCYDSCKCGYWSTIKQWK